MPGDTHHILIDRGSEGTRLDQALASILPLFSRSHYGRLIDEGRVSVDGEIVRRRSHPVREGQSVVIEVPPAQPSEIQPQDIPLTVLWQDASLAVIDKPAGLVVHPAAGHSEGTMVNALLHHVDDLSGIGGITRPGIVHRLDKDTSGVMVIAKSDEAHRRLMSVWGTPAVRKEYVALVYGTPSPERGAIERPIGRHPRDRKKMAVVEGGRAAATDYELLERYSGVSLLRCSLRTGRTHQIRVHLSSIGHPVVGDPVYSGPQWRGIPDRRLQRLLAGFPRQALHASSLSFPHPLTGEPMRFTSPLPPDMQTLLDAIRNPGGAPR